MQPEQLRSKHAGPSRFDVEHRACVLSAVISAASFLKAMINELYQDAHDGHGISGDGYIAPLSPQAREMLAQLWRGTAEGSRLKTLEKYQLLLLAAGQQRLDTGAQPYQDAHLLVQLRNALAHFQPEDLAADESSTMERRLRGKFSENPLMVGAGNPWWPDHALSHGCAVWACRSAVALADLVAESVEIHPNYRRLRVKDWEGFARAPGSAPTAASP